MNFSLHQNPHKNERDKGSDVPAYSEEYRQLVDIKGLTINRDKSGLKRNDSTSDRADSLIPYPDSLILKPDSLSTPLSSSDDALLPSNPVTKKKDETPYDQIVNSYHNHLPTLPGVRKLTDTRKRHIRARWDEIVKQDKGLSYFDSFFDYASGSEFLTKGTFDLEWLMKEANHLKVTEGKYHNE